MLPNVTGGANWQGGSFDPETGHLLHLHEHRACRTSGSCRAASSRTCGTSAARRSNPSNPKAPPIPLTVQGLPLVKPPYGRITALDLKTGTMAWQIAHGETPDNIRNHPALKGVTIPRTGRQGRIGTLVTKTLVVAGEGGRVHAARRPPRRDAAGLRQGQRQGDGRGLHAGAADRARR